MEKIIISVKYIYNYLPQLIINSANLFPKYLFLFILILLIIYSWFRKINNLNEVIIEISIIAFIILFSFICVLLPSVISLDSFGSGRLLFSIGSLIGNIILYLYIKEENYGSTSERIIIIIIAVLYFFINIINVCSVTYKASVLEKSSMKNSIKIGEYIEEYEKKNNIKVTKIAMTTDSKFVNGVSDATRDILAYRGAINFYNNIELENADMEEHIYNEYFKDKNWDSFSTEQLIFIEDTLYYCMY